MHLSSEDELTEDLGNALQLHDEHHSHTYSCPSCNAHSFVFRANFCAISAARTFQSRNEQEACLRDQGLAIVAGFQVYKGKGMLRVGLSEFTGIPG